MAVRGHLALVDCLAIDHQVLEANRATEDDVNCVPLFMSKTHTHTHTQTDTHRERRRRTREKSVGMGRVIHTLTNTMKGLPSGTRGI